MQAIKLNQHFATLVESSKELRLAANPSFALSVFCMKVPEGIADPVNGIQNELTLKLAQQFSVRKDITVTKIKQRLLDSILRRCSADAREAH